MDARLRTSIATRLLDQCMLDDSMLVALYGDDPEHAVELRRFERHLAVRRAVKNLPFVGPSARAFYQRIVRGRRFDR